MISFVLPLKGCMGDRGNVLLRDRAVWAIRILLERRIIGRLFWQVFFAAFLCWLLVYFALGRSQAMQTSLGSVPALTLVVVAIVAAALHVPLAAGLSCMHSGEMCGRKRRVTMLPGVHRWLANHSARWRNNAVVIGSRPRRVFLQQEEDSMFRAAHHAIPAAVRWSVATAVTALLVALPGSLRAGEADNWQQNHPEWLWCDDFESADTTLSRRYQSVHEWILSCYR